MKLKRNLRAARSALQWTEIFVTPSANDGAPLHGESSLAIERGRRGICGGGSLARGGYTARCCTASRLAQSKGGEGAGGGRTRGRYSPRWSGS